MSTSEAELSIVLKARNLAGREVDRLGTSLGKIKGHATSAAGGLLSVAKTASILAGGGLLALISSLGFATHAAADEQTGIAKMNAALKASDKSFKGNTDAIEGVIAQREKLAFSDDDLRASLAQLVTKYHDSDKALRLQATAMDLARLKGISLQDASLMLSKGLDGNSKVLKTLGIDLPKTATEQQRLTAIQKAAAGQAQAYGDTAAGAQKSFQIAIGDVVEDIGGALLPVMTQAFRFLLNVGIPAIRAIIGRVQKWIAENKPLIEQVKKFVSGALTALWKVISTVVTWIGNLVGSIASNKDAMNVLKTVAKLIADAFVLAWQAIQDVIGFIAKLVDMITSNQGVMKIFHGVWDGLATVMGGVADVLRTIIDLASKAFEALGKVKLTRTGNDPIGDFFFGSKPGNNANGGWVGLNGPELSWLGERGPEYVVPNHQLGSMGGASHGHAIILDGRRVAQAVDEHAHYALNRQPATAIRG